MGRTITIVCIISLILALSFFATSYAKNTKNEIHTLASEALYACKKEDEQLLNEKIKSLSELFSERQDFLSFYVRHDEIEKLECAIVSLNGYAETESYKDVYSLLFQIDYQASHIYQRESLNLDGLL